MEKGNNIIFSCTKHGKEQYFKIRKLGEKSNPGCAYVWFEHESYGVERMWVKTIKGDRKKGSGVLINTPIKMKALKHGDFVEYKTNKDNIAYAKHIYEGPFCECCGDPVDETNHKKSFWGQTIH